MKRIITTALILGSISLVTANAFAAQTFKCTYQGDMYGKTIVKEGTKKLTITNGVAKMESVTSSIFSNQTKSYQYTEDYKGTLTASTTTKYDTVKEQIDAIKVLENRFNYFMGYSTIYLDDGGTPWILDQRNEELFVSTNLISGKSGIAIKITKGDHTFVDKVKSDVYKCQSTSY